jgi:hypothetical protein
MAYAPQPKEFFNGMDPRQTLVLPGLMAQRGLPLRYRTAPLDFYCHMCNLLMHRKRLTNASGGERRVVRDQRQRGGK